jgi:hypothetical protein
VAFRVRGADSTTWFAAVVVALALVVAVAVVRGVVDAPVMRRRGVNIEATRGASSPQLWLVAHLDSKSQPVPMLVRVAGVIVLAVGLLAVVVSLFLRVEATAFPLAIV